MIGFVDSLVLARTKLRAKKVRLIVTVVVSGLIFGFIIGGMSLVGALGKSLDDYAHQQFDGKYFVSTMYQSAIPMEYYDTSRDPAIIKEINQLQSEYVKERTAAAKRLGVEYDASTEVPTTLPDPYADTSLPKDQQVVINQSSVGYQKYSEAEYAKKLASAPAPTIDALRAVSEAHHPSATTEIVPASTAQAQFMKDGKETFEPSTTSEVSTDIMMAGMPTTNLQELTYSQTDEAALKSFMMPANTERRQVNKAAIPVVVPLSAAVKQFGEKAGIGARPKDADELITWMNDARDKLNGQTYALCYRNTSSQQLVQQAVAQRQEIAQNKSTPDYRAPEVLYTLPSEDSCGAVITNDKQSNAAKSAASKQLQFQRESDPYYEEPAQAKLTFVIVGVVPDAGEASMMSLESFVQLFFGTTLQPGAIIPKQSYDALSEADRHQNILFATPKTSEEKFNARYGQSFLLEFDNVANARQFIMNRGCDQMTAFMSGCPADRPFVLLPFGTNYVAMSQAMTFIRPVLIGVLIIVGSIAAITIMAMMGRVMADSRRETAVFRAIGARRSDIVKVYMLYAAAIALRIVLFALLLGGLLVLILELLYAKRATQYAEVMYGVFNGGASFHFIGWSPYIAVVVGVIIAIGLIGVIPPLIRNVRRNPITDMREE